MHSCVEDYKRLGKKKLLLRKIMLIRVLIFKIKAASNKFIGKALYLRTCQRDNMS